MRRALHIFLLAFTLLLAQAGVGVHAVEHLASSHDDGMSSEVACELCVGYAQLGAGALPAYHAALPVCTASAAPLPALAGLFSSLSVFQVRARAPPVFS